MLERPVFFALLIALLLLSGCVQELGISERQKCIELATKAHAFVPACETESACFAKVEASLFGFDEAVFSADVRQELYAFKNRLALSWLYFSKAGSEAAAIREICSSKQNTSALGFHVNELNHGLALAFKYNSLAFESAFSALLLENNALEEEGIELVSEEPLFSTYALLNQNLNDLDASNTGGSGFASHYLNQSAQLQSLVESTGFSRAITSETTLLDLLEPRSRQVSELAQKRASLQVPFLSEAFTGFVAYINGFFKTSQAASSLQAFPSFEFFQVFNGFASSGNSSASKFSQLFRSASKSRQELLESNSLLEARLQEELSVVENAIEVLSVQDFGVFDQNLLSEMYSLLGKSSSVEVQRFGIQSLGNFREQALAELSALKNRLFFLQRNDFLGKVSLGKKTLELKLLLADAKSLNENIAYVGSELVDGIELLCVERVEQIGESLSGAGLQGFSGIGDLQARLRFKTAKFLEAGQSERIVLCREILLEHSSLELALQDFYSFSVARLSSFSDCLNGVEEVLSNPIPGLALLHDFRARLEQIKALEPSQENIHELNMFCGRLHSDLEAAVQQTSAARALADKYGESGSKVLGLLEMAELFPESVSNDTVDGFSKKLSSLSKYFSGSSIVLDEALPVMPELEEQLSLLEPELDGFYASALSSVLSKTFSFVVSHDSVPVLGSKGNARARLLLENPFGFDVSQKQVVSIPFAFEFAGLLDSSPNVLSAEQSGKQLLISLSSIPKGFTFIDMNLVVETAFTEKTTLLSVDQFRAVFEKRIETELNAGIPNLVAEFDLLPNSPLNIVDVKAYANGRPVQFSKQGNRLSVSLDGGNSLLVYFAVVNPVSIATNVVEHRKLTQFKSFYRLEVFAENLLPIPLYELRLKMPLNMNESSVRVLEFVDSAGKSVKFSAPSGQNLSIVLDELFPGQKGHLFLSIEVNNPSVYWLQMLEEEKARAAMLVLSESGTVAAGALSISSELDAFEEGFFEDRQQLDNFTALSAKLQSLESSEQDFFSLSQQFHSLKEQLDNSLGELHAQTLLLSGLGFGAESEKAGSAAREISFSVAEAEKLLEKGNARAAVEKMFAASSAASSFEISNASAFILEQANSVANRFKDLASKAGVVGFSFSMDTEKQFLMLLPDVDSLLEKNQLAPAKSALDKASAQLQELEETLNQKALQESESIAARISAFLDSTNSALPALFVTMLPMFEETTLAQAFASKYIPPISFSRLKKALVEAESLSSPLLKEKFEEFFLLRKQGKHLEAIALSKGFLQQLEEKESKASALTNELENALNLLREDAAASFNFSASLFNQSAFNAEAAGMLEQSQKSISAGMLLSSIVESRAVASLLSMPYPQSQFPLYLLPIIAAAVLVAVVRVVRKKKHKETAKKLERVLAAWEK